MCRAQLPALNALVAAARAMHRSQRMISFISDFLFSVYSSFASLGKFIPRYSIIFVAVVNGIDYFISLSDFSLLVYRNASDFCVLILNLATLLNSLVSSSNFLILSLGFSMYSIMSSANN